MAARSRASSFFMMFHHPLNYIFVWGAGQARSSKLPLYIVVSLGELVNISFIIGWRDMISMTILGYKKISPRSAGGDSRQYRNKDFAWDLPALFPSYRIAFACQRVGFANSCIPLTKKIGCATYAQSLCGIALTARVISPCWSSLRSRIPPRPAAPGRFWAGALLHLRAGCARRCTGCPKPSSAGTPLRCGWSS